MQEGSAAQRHAVSKRNGTLGGVDDELDPAVADGIVYLASTDGNLYAFSVNGVFPASRLPGGELGVKPAISSLKPDFSLKPATH